MKNLVILSEESVFGGIVRSGMAEMVDCLANALTSDYNVSIICVNSGGGLPYAIQDLYKYNDHVIYTKFSNVNYYLVEPYNWESDVKALLKELEIDIFHNCTSQAHYIDAFENKPVRSVLTFDSYNVMPGPWFILDKYDYITTVSEAYAEEALASDTPFGKYLRLKDNFVSCICGISGAAFNPSSGFLLPASYSSDYQTGKAICKRHLLSNYAIKNTPCIFTMMCRLIHEKNIEAVLEVLPKIKENNGLLIVVGTGDKYYEDMLSSYKREDGLLFINRFVSPLQAPALLSGSDFYLTPSRSESCGLMPMTASIFGAIPISSQAGGLKNNLNEDNAIVIDTNLSDAIDEAFNLYHDSGALFNKRQICMDQTHFYWETRKNNYIKLYEA